MRKQFQEYNRIFFSSLLLVFFLALSLPVQAEQVEVGRVLAATKGVTAQQPDQEPRELRRRSLIYLGDTLSTPEGGRAQLRMDDGEMISMTASSQLVIESFSHDSDNPESESESSVKRLVQGGLRTITGAVGGDGYRIESRAGTIGIRGTSFDLFTQNGENLYARSHRGNLYVENDQGRAEFGAGEAQNAAQVTAVGAPPEAISAEDLPDFFDQNFEEDTSLSMADDDEEETTADSEEAGNGGWEDDNSQEISGDELMLASTTETITADRDDPASELGDNTGLAAGPFGFFIFDYSAPVAAGSFFSDSINYRESVSVSGNNGDLLLSSPEHANSFYFSLEEQEPIYHKKMGDSDVYWGTWLLEGGGAEVTINDSSYDQGIVRMVFATQVHNNIETLPSGGLYSFDMVNDIGNIEVNFSSGLMSFDLTNIGYGDGTITEFYSDTGVELDNFVYTQGRFVGTNIDGVIAAFRDSDGLLGVGVFERSN
ncbi:FecR domain-containing protein [Marinospirillum sp.]|uniref:FecR family protein n=1 Tax=Marinospirillum sp. TaxID=2183934 RepID=UPI00384CB54A